MRHYVWVVVAAVALAAAVLAAAWRFLPTGADGTAALGGGINRVRVEGVALARCAQYLGASEFTYEHCLINQAVEQRSGSVCDLLSKNYVPMCLTALAAAVGDVGRCPGSAGSSEWMSCVATVAQSTQSFELCHSLGGDSAKRCYLNVAVATGEAENCSLYHAELGDEQHLYCVVRLGAKLNDARACATLTEQFERDHCFYLSAKALGQPQLCDEIQYVYSPPVGGGCGEGECFSADRCKAELAGAVGNGELCRQIAEASFELRAECFFNVASSTGEAKWCDELAGGSASYRADTCYRAAAARGAKVETCFKVRDSNSRASCIELSVDASTTLATCDGATDDFSRALCYAGVGRASGDLSVCDQLPGGGGPEWAMDWPESCRDLAASQYWNVN